MSTSPAVRLPGSRSWHQRRGQRAAGIIAAAIGSMLTAETSPESPDELQVLQDEEDKAEEGEELHEDRQTAGRQAAAGEDPGSSSGLARRISNRTKPARTRCRRPGRPAVLADSHPWLGASMIEYTSTTMPSTASTAPLTSSGGRAGQPTRATKRRVPARRRRPAPRAARTPTATTRPPGPVPQVSSPSTADPPATAAQTLTARVALLAWRRSR